LDRIRQKIDGRVPRELLEKSFDRDDASSGTMPDLLGLTMREASTRLSDMGINFEFAGSGVVIGQNPKPFLPIQPGLRANITFGPESKFIRREIASVRQPLKGSFSQTTGTGAMPGDGQMALLLNSGAGTVQIEAQRADADQAQIASRRFARPTATPVPDMDQYAQGSAVPGAGKQAWSRWLKEQARITKEEEKTGKKGNRRSRLVNESENESPSDNSDVIDPDFSSVGPDESVDAEKASSAGQYHIARGR
jgi:hypothetical protein